MAIKESGISDEDLRVKMGQGYFSMLEALDEKRLGGVGQCTLSKVK